jgi:NADPH2:quinone reductase
MRYVSVTSLGGPGVLQLREGPQPDFAPDEVLIDVAFVGVGGIDAIVRRGDLGAANPVPPFTPGLEVSGEVAVVGGNVHDLHPGDRVAALLLLQMGGYAERVRCPATSVVLVPPGVELADAASLVNPTTALVALDIVQPHAGETLVAHGATGGLGSAIGRVAKALHPDVATIGVVRRKRKDGVVPNTSYDRILTTEELAAAVQDGTSYDVILDPVGGELRRTSLDALAPRGRLALLGNVSGDEASLVPSQGIWLKSLSVHGLNLGYLNSVDPARVRAAAQQIVKLAADRRLDLSPTRTFPFSHAAAAHEHLESGQAHGQLVLAV